MKGKIIADWSKVDFSDPASRKKAYGALQHFMDVPSSPAFKQAMQHFGQTADWQKALQQIQHVATPSDFPTSVLSILRDFQVAPAFDNAFERCFDVVDMTSSQRNGFELLDVEDGLTFSKVPDGEKARIYKFAGAKTSVTFDMYGAGLGWLRRLMDDREYWTMEKNAMAFRNRWYKDRADVVYALIEAMSSGINLAWQAPVPAALAATDPNYTAIRDIETINKACETIFTACKDKGYGMTPNSQFTLLYPYQLSSRITRAMGLLNQNLAGAQRGLVYNVNPVMTLGLTVTNKYYVCLPGQKNIFADRMNLTMFDKFDEMSYSDLSVGWGRYGGAIGDTAQWVRAAIS